MTERPGDIPRKEYLRLKNEIAEALAKANLNGREFRLVWYVIRVTYGYRRTSWEISKTEFMQGTDLIRRDVDRYLKNLIEMNIIKRDKSVSKRYPRYSFNKYFTQWNCRTNLSKPKKRQKKDKSVLKKDKSVLKRDKSVSSHLLLESTIKEQSKEQVASENQMPPDEPKSLEKKSSKKHFDSDSNEYILAEFLLKKIHTNIPDYRYAKSAQREPTIQRWAKDIDFMIRIDGRDPDLIKLMIEWVQDTSNSIGEFWASNIMSGKKLREKYDELGMKINREMAKNRKSKHKQKMDRILGVFDEVEKELDNGPKTGAQPLTEDDGCIL